MKADVGDYFYRLLHPSLTVLLISKSGSKVNVMACSWCMPVSEDPPLVAVAVSKDSLTNQLIRESGEFTISIPPSTMLAQVWKAGTVSGRKVDKIRELGLKLAPPKATSTPSIDGCLASLECKVANEVEAGECTLFIGEVKAAYADRRVFKRGLWDLSRAGLLLHLGSRQFTVPHERVQPPKQASRT